MIKSYLKTAVRTLLRNKSYTLLNLVGLVIGISFSCMLYVYVSHELSYDRFHHGSDRMFRVLTFDGTDPQHVRNYGVTVPPFGAELKSNFPQVEDVVRLHRLVGQVVFEIDGKDFQERDWYTTDANFFQFFNFEFLAGDPATALQQPHSVVLTETMAKKCFGGEDALGNVIEKTSFGAVTVTGVVKDPPSNSHLNFKMIFSQIVSGDPWDQYLTNWGAFSAYTYLRLKEGSTIQDLQTRASEAYEKNFAKSGDISFGFQPMVDIYLNSEDVEAGTESGHGQMSYIYIFTSMAIFLLLLASINYINLATSRAVIRSREIGVRKVAGAKRGQLIAQFLTESILLTFISAVIAIAVMHVSFPYFNQITGKDFAVSKETLMDFLPAFSLIAVVVGLISGGYPAFYLSKLKPVSSLRNLPASGSSSISLRKVLVVFQFVITVVMIVSTLVIAKQMHFVRTADIGFDKDRLMVIDINNGNVRRQFQTIKNEYLSIPGVDRVAVSTRVPGEWKNIQEIYVKSSASPAGTPDSTKTYFMGFDEDMLQTYRLSLKEGRNFNPSINDSTNILLNESAVEALGLIHPIGATVAIGFGSDIVNATVIGVVSNFNFQSLHSRVAPIVIGAWNSPFQYIDYFSLKISGDVDEVVEKVTKVHEKFDNATPIEYHFLDQQLENFYVAEQRAGMIFRMAGGLSILVACLGLFGLASYHIQRRTKELGIRKVLGASGVSLFVLLSSSFAKQVGIAFLIATPIAWYMMRQWLHAFEYRIQLTAWIFLLAGLIAILIALLTIAYRTLKAVRVNPVSSLRQE